MPTHILIVEDEPGIALSLRSLLERERFVVTDVPTLREARVRLASAPAVELLILDLGLPDGSGDELLREVRNAGALPVLVLTSRGDEIDRVVGLELGADDYVTKPFSVREVVARVKSLLRRSRAVVVAEAPASASTDGLRIDAERRRAWFGATELMLTKTELDLLQVLHERPGHVWTRDALLDRVWGDVAITDRTVDAHVKGLRRKLQAVSPAADGVETVRGVGYRWRERP